MNDGALLAAVFARSERMVGRRVADEFLLVPLAGRGADVDSMYNLNRVGAFIWERLDAQADGRTVVAALVERFDVGSERAAADYCAFMRLLESVHAVRRISSPGGDRPASRA